MDVNLPRDKETGKQKGFGFLMYEDQRSTILAVDNLNGAKVLDRTLRVDHVKNYKQPKSKGEDGVGDDEHRPDGARASTCGTALASACRLPRLPAHPGPGPRAQQTAFKPLEVYMVLQ